MAGGGLPNAYCTVLIYCAEQCQPTAIPCFLRAHRRRTPVDPRVCFWKKHIQELKNITGMTSVSQSHRKRVPVGGQASEACQPKAPHPFHSQQVSTEEPLHQKGMAVYARTTPAACSLPPPLPRASIKRGVCWMSCLQTSVHKPYVKYPVTVGRLDKTSHSFSLCTL